MKKIKIIILVGPSGSGKTYLAQQLKAKGIPELVSHTTRKQREGETEGESYYFVTKEEFDKIPMIETVEYSGNYYGSSVDEVEKKLSTAELVYVITDIHGLKQYQDMYGDKVLSIFIKSDPVLAIKRMFDRNDKPEDIYNRIKNMIEKEETKNSSLCDFIYNNDTDLELNSTDFYHYVLSAILVLEQPNIY